MPSSATVLVVEDDVALQHLYRVELEGEGYRVLLADTGREAIRLLQRVPLDLIILDWMLRDGDPVDVLHQALARTRRIPVIINTGYSLVSANYFTWLADRFLVKSSDLSALKQAVHECLLSRVNAPPVQEAWETHDHPTNSAAGTVI